MPWPPTTMPPAFDQLEPGPVTVTVPTPPGRLPIVPKESANVPPLWIVSIPVRITPTLRFRAKAPGSLITVAFRATVSMFASSVCLGKRAGLQLPLKNQLEVNVPVQSRVWACDETVDAAKSANVASKVNEKNSQRGRTGDTVPWRGAVDDSRCGSYPITAPNQLEKPGRHSPNSQSEGSLRGRPQLWRW